MFCYVEFQREELKKNKNSLYLACKFQDNINKTITPHDDFVLINEGVYFANELYHWNYFQRLNKQFQKKNHLKMFSGPTIGKALVYDAGVIKIYLQLKILAIDVKRM